MVCKVSSNTIILQQWRKLSKEEKKRVEKDNSVDVPSPVKDAFFRGTLIQLDYFSAPSKTGIVQQAPPKTQIVW